MKTATLLVPLPKVELPARYQIYRQAKNGCHHPYGGRTEMAAEAVEVFLAASPLYEGGAIHLWDHHQQRSVAATNWTREKTGFGFEVHTRANVFQEPGLAAIARLVAEREQMAASMRVLA